MDNWISVETELPKQKVFYNVYCETDSLRLVHSLHWDGEDWCFDNETGRGEEIFTGGGYIGVTHWQSLPLPPKENNK